MALLAVFLHRIRKWRKAARRIDFALGERLNEVSGFEIDRSHFSRKNGLKSEEVVQEELGDGGFRNPDNLSLQILRFFDPPVPSGDHFHAAKRRSPR